MADPGPLREQCRSQPLCLCQKQPPHLLRPLRAFRRVFWGGSFQLYRGVCDFFERSSIPFATSSAALPMHSAADPGEESRIGHQNLPKELSTRCPAQRRLPPPPAQALKEQRLKVRLPSPSRKTPEEFVEESCTAARKNMHSSPCSLDREQLWKGL